MALAQHTQFLGQGPALQRALHGGHQVLGRKRLFDEIVGAVAHGVHGQGHVAMAGDQHHWQVGVLRAQGAQQAHAAHARHLDVGDDHGGPVLAEGVERGLSIGEGADLDIGQRQRLRVGAAHHGVVFDEIDARAAVRRWVHGISCVAETAAVLGTPCTPGRPTVNSAPPCTRLAATSVPPMPSTMMRETASPRPRPSPALVV